MIFEFQNSDILFKIRSLFENKLLCCYGNMSMSQPVNTPDNVRQILTELANKHFAEGLKQTFC